MLRAFVKRLPRVINGLGDLDLWRKMLKAEPNLGYCPRPVGYAMRWVKRAREKPVNEEFLGYG